MRPPNNCTKCFSVCCFIFSSAGFSFTLMNNTLLLKCEKPCKLISTSSILNEKDCSACCTSISLPSSCQNGGSNVICAGDLKATTQPNCSFIHNLNCNTFLFTSA